MTLYKCQHCHAINAPHAPGEHLLFCRVCSGPVEVVSDDLPFESSAKFHQAGNEWSYEIGEPGSRLIAEGFPDQETAMNHFLKTQAA